MLTQKAVSNRELFCETISGILSSSSRSGTIARQINPRPCRAMKLIASGVIFSAAMVRSPSFSRSSSSTTITILPARMAAMASSTRAKGREQSSRLLITWSRCLMCAPESPLPFSPNGLRTVPSFGFGIRYAEHETRCRRQNVADARVHHAEMRVLWCVWSYEPGSAGEVRILRVILKRAVRIAFPERLQPVECDLLNGSVVGVRRARSAIADDRARGRGIRGVHEKIPPEIIRAVITSERGSWTRYPLKAGGSCSGMHQRRRDVGSRGVRTNNQLRSVSHQVARAAVAPKRIAKQQEISE